MKTSRHLCFVLIITLSLSLLLAARSGLAASDYHSQSRFPISLSVTNNCNDELVTFSGEIHVSSHRHDNKDGSTTYSATIDFSNAFGTGEITGDRYVFGSNAHSVTTFPAGSTEFYSYTSRETIRLVSNGPDPNHDLTLLWNFVFDETGFHTTLYDYHLSCSGN